MPRLGANQRAVLAALYPDRVLWWLSIATTLPGWDGNEYEEDAETETACREILDRWAALGILTNSLGPTENWYALTDAGRALAEAHGCTKAGDD